MPESHARLERAHPADMLIGERLLFSAAAWIGATHPGSGMHLWVFEENVRARIFFQRLGGRGVERDISAMPSANGKSLLRLRWADAERLSREHRGSAASPPLGPSDG